MKHCLTFLLLVLINGMLWAGEAHALPSFQDVRAAYIKSDSLLLDRHGAVLQELRTDKKGRRLDWTPLGDISPALTEAVICSEDKRFYMHAGMDYQALGIAALGYLSGTGSRGASTITMQLASLLDRGAEIRIKKRSLRQKVRQILMARQIEKCWSKDEILEAYFNLITFHGEHAGISAASRGLFAKDPHGLDRPESLVLASLIRSPNTQALMLENRTRRLNRRLGWHVPDTAIRQKIQSVYLGMNRVFPRSNLAPHIARRLLKNRPAGVPTVCTLDARLQEFAAQQLARQVNALTDQHVGQGALLVLENKTGDVLAYVSYSSDPQAGTFVDGVRALRQTGSTLKPFLYAAALERRILTAASLLDDSPLDVSIPGGIYQPENYDSVFHGPVSVRTALASSLNVPAVRTLALVGTETFLDILKQLGIQSLMESGDYYGLSLALGSADISLWELTNAYRTLANRGVWREARLMPESKKPKTPSKKVFSPQTAFIVSDILADRDARSDTFGLENPLATRFWTAVKTGTSKDMRDNWCLGYSSRYTVGVWVGNFSGESMWNVSGMTGSAPVWNLLMNYLHNREESSPLAPPDGLVRMNPGRHHRFEWFIAGTQPDRPQTATFGKNPRIVYPPSGTVIAIDPDIPGHLQKINFVAEAGEDGPTHWLLNGRQMDDRGHTVLWTPKPGSHVLAITDNQNVIIHRVQFEVR